MTKRRIHVIVLSMAVLVLSASAAFAQTASPSPSASRTTTPEIRAGNAIFGIIVLTAFAAAGYYVAKWIRRGRSPRPPGPWFGGGFGRDREP